MRYCIAKSRSNCAAIEGQEIRLHFLFNRTTFKEMVLLNEDSAGAEKDQVMWDSVLFYVYSIKITMTTRGGGGHARLNEITRGNCKVRYEIKKRFLLNQCLLFWDCASLPGWQQLLLDASCCVPASIKDLHWSELSPVKTEPSHLGPLILLLWPDLGI